MEEISKNNIKIVLLENIHSNAFKAFHENGFSNLENLSTSLTGQELVSKIKDANLLGIRSATHLTKDILKQCPQLLGIGCFCIGTDQVDLQAAMLQGIPVFNDPHSNTRSVAELVIGLSIALFRDLVVKNTAAHAGLWKKASKGSHELRGKTLGIIGYGRIGAQVAILAEAMGLNVYFYDVELKLTIGNAKPVQSIEELLTLSDIVTVHVPESESTRHLINKDRLRYMKKSGFLINTSRGNVVDMEALLEALDHKALKGAAIDVFLQEPKGENIPFITPLQKHENVILTPHIGGATEEAQEKIAFNVAQKLINHVNHGSTEGATNFPTIILSPLENVQRILHVHENIPGILSQINTLLSERGINILSQYLKTTAEIGYVVFDIEKKVSKDLFHSLNAIKGTIRSRILY